VAEAVAFVAKHRELHKDDRERFVKALLEGYRSPQVLLETFNSYETAEGRIGYLDELRAGLQ
jgi:hypothetical protein